MRDYPSTGQLENPRKRRLMRQKRPPKITGRFGREKKRWSKTQRIVFIGVLLFAASIGGELGKRALEEIYPSQKARRLTFNDLVEIAKAANADLPKMADESTELTRMRALSEGLMAIDYKLLDIPESIWSELGASDRMSLEEQMRRILLTLVCDENTLLRKQVVIHYTYSSNDGAPLFKIEVAPSDCGH